MQAHWLDEDRTTIGADELDAQGVHYQRLDTEPAAYQGPLDALKEANGYVEQDEVALSPETPNLEQVCAKFLDEHLHDEDEVRFVLDGAGVFEIRSRDDRWMKVTVEKGDLIVVPKERYHRFYLTDDRRIRCVRLFQDPSGWVPHYRG
ncbi:MAG TPA: cupin domain-containing protein [Sandaracinaceae bacterium LLY-WYZ-13_1]|nr:cupin domain-containing protein [Sandaracinaceae bacterium LLY-WYZ-13_1]